MSKQRDRAIFLMFLAAVAVGVFAWLVTVGQQRWPEALFLTALATFPAGWLLAQLFALVLVAWGPPSRRAQGTSVLAR